MTFFNRIAVIFLLVFASGILGGCATIGDSASDSLRKPEGGERTFSILSINDVYRIEGLQSGDGGLARVRSLRKDLERQFPDLLFLHGGDLLYPSLISRDFDGKQMIDILNLMDGSVGNPEIDTRMFVVFGNHEFDKTNRNGWVNLKSRIEESEFSWLGTNIAFEPGYDISSPKLLSQKIVTSGGVKVGIFSLTIDVGGIEYARFRSSRHELAEIAFTRSQMLRNLGAEFVIALTHLPVPLDETVLADSRGPDLIIGGHEHDAVNLKVNGRCILKADADAKSAVQTTVTISKGKPPRVVTQLHPLGPSGQYGLDPMVDRAVQLELQQHQTYFCKKKGLPNTDCLNDPIARTSTELIGEETRIRSRESNLGDYVADLMLAEAKKSAPEKTIVALVNSGALRLNQNLDAGSQITRRNVEELIQYNDPLYLIPVTAAEIQTALDHAVDKRGEGPWLQVSGLSFDADLTKNKATNIQVGGKPLTTVSDIFAVMPRYIVTRGGPDEGDHDGFHFSGNNSHLLGVKIKDVVYDGLENKAPVVNGDRTISPTVDGRIRLINQSGPAKTMARCTP